MIASLLLWFKHRTARKAERAAQARLAELVAQTPASREHQNFLDRRRAALKGHALKKVRANG